jgi:regulator of sigma E protease
MVNFLIAFFSIVVLATLHELGHFLIAKKCGVKVEEFGLGFPPRILGKKIGETIYSFNWIPLGAFVKMEGEEEKVDSVTSFSNQPIKNKIWITLGGVISFWLIAILIYTFLFSQGARVAIQDSENQNLTNFQVGIFSVVKNSPAGQANIQPGDMIKSISYETEEIEPETIEEVQNFISDHSGEKVKIVLKRGDQIIEKEVLAREEHPENEGAIGVSLLRTGILQYPWYLSFWKGIQTTWENTIMTIRSYGMMMQQIVGGEFQDENLVSSIGIFQMIAQSQDFGFLYFLSFMALISINLAVFNSLPIPLVDGGRVAFLLVEAIRKKPLPEKIEKRINVTSFALLGTLVIWVTIRDIINLF